MDRIDWPGPNRYRSASGVPGPDYWQQRADYRINASLDTATTEISGAVEIRYTNNSPDTLHPDVAQGRLGNDAVRVVCQERLAAAFQQAGASFPADMQPTAVWPVTGIMMVS